MNRQAEEHKLESELLLWNRYQLAFLKDDTDASAIELGQTTSGLTIFLCPTYVRGEAYLMLHDGKAAAADFQKFIDHGGLVTNFPRGALECLELARAYAMQEDTTKAKSAY